MENLRKIASHLKVFFSITGKFLVILAAMTIGYFISEVKNSYRTNSNEDTTFSPTVKTLEDVIISFSAGGEIIIMDKKDGEIQIFSDSISTEIFHYHAMKIHYSK